VEDLLVDVLLVLRRRPGIVVEEGMVVVVRWDALVDFDPLVW